MAFSLLRFVFPVLKKGVRVRKNVIENGDGWNSGAEFSGFSGVMRPENDTATWNNGLAGIENVLVNIYYLIEVWKKYMLEIVDA